MAKIESFFRLMNKQGASDLHLTTGSPPVLRINGEMKTIKYNTLTDSELRELLFEITPEHRVKEFEETGDVDFAHEVPGLARYRVNFYQQKKGIGAAFREIPNILKTADDLGLPEVLKSLVMLPRGLVLVTGPTGSGKSTTLAAMLDHANSNRTDHIITIEDPIEFVHENKGCLVNHREVPTHTRTFSTALRAALREDPDIIMVGELRDLETISLAIEAAMTGHLVVGTLHTISAAKTVDRIIEIFPDNQQAQIRSTLADALRGVVSQTLFKRVDRKGGRCAAMEIMIATPAVRNLIRDGKTHQVLSSIETGKRFGMQSLDDSIWKLLQEGLISSQEAYMKCVDKGRFQSFVDVTTLDFTEA